MNTTSQETNKPGYSNGSHPLSAIHSTLYPSQPALKKMAKSPLLLWRLGLGFLIGQLFMIITTTGRKSVLPRRTVVEYRNWNGRIYALAAWAKADWYRNIQADPYVTIQTADGTESVIARRVTDTLELAEIYQYLKDDTIVQAISNLLGFPLTRENYFEHKDKIHLLAFDPTGEPTPLPLETDLVWLWPVAFVVMILGILLGRRAAE